MPKVTIELDEDGDLMVWQVRLSNYEPPEIDSLWFNEEDANARVNELRGSGIYWTVGTTWVQGSRKK